MIRPDVFVPGNHEFDFGKAVFFQRMAEANFPIYAANLRGPDGARLPGIRDSEIVTVDGIRIGIVGGLFRPKSGDVGWRLSFVLGMLAAPLLYFVVAGPTAVRIDAGWATLVVAGLLVGVGTRFGSGCTSGHGVCGLSRLSPRSLMATLAFMGAGFVTVYLVRHALAV